ncbi:hypothetical protein KPL70_023285 [Citrus sinensis]|nr:hypothetical protein KPL70_023285 [Citrus sinensis]
MVELRVFQAKSPAFWLFSGDDDNGDMTGVTQASNQYQARPVRWSELTAGAGLRMMRVFLQALDYENWEIVCNGSFIPRKNALNKKEFHRVSNCSNAYEIWRKLEVVYEETTNEEESHEVLNLALMAIGDESNDELDEIANAQLDINNLSLGRLFQLALVSLDYLCDQKKFFRNLMKDQEGFQTACKKPYLEIKCKDSKHCTCPSTKKHHKVRFHRKSSRTPQSRPFPRRPKKIRYFRRRQPSEILDRRRTKSRCFICKKLGHFAKECPKNPKRSQRLVQQFQSLHQFSPDADQIEFLYSEQESPDPDTVFALGTSDSDSDSTSSTEPEDYSPVFHIQSVPSSSTQLSVQPIPSVKIQILLSKYSRPIPAIAFIDTGAQRSILNPAILPPETWISNENHFRAASGKLFSTKLRTKSRIGIQLFPKLTVWTHVIGSSLPDKDLLLGFDILFQAQKIQVLPTGLRFQSMFQPYTDQLKLYHLAQSPPDYQSISAQLLRFCPPNHLAFAHPHPLWKNPAHFVKLPFKLNEDLNPTKATHPGMPPSELQLAQTECAELLAQGLIEPTTSPWACQAFYVNKRAETLRGKKRLVIDYQPLNQFLQDDKFPLPRKNSIFTYLQNARIFSKFDLKSGFWQLGIDPAERYKTAFCIPNAHYQWTVLPFGLKTAPSIFQKAMTQIFQPLLHHTLVYIDDLLLFSGTPEEHQVLLQQFHDIIAHYGIMLSDKKSTIATDTVEYLGLQIKNRFYQPGPHIAQELLHFPDKDFTKKQVQQFLGIINYIRDFLPHVDQQTSILSALLKKNPISWDSRHATAVQRLKQIAQNPPQLKIMTDGKRILQTDASDTSWGALLLEQIDKKEYLIGYASGHFSPAQQHYHTIYKEILAVKNGIKKFEYHLLGHRFLIRLDNSSFPKVLQFKGKTIPNSQSLRLQEWFSRYEFDVAHIKGQKNLIPDFLSRIQTPASPIFYTSPVFPIFMATRSTATSLPSKALTQKTFPRPVQTFPSLYRLQEFAKQFLFRYYMKAFFLEENPHNQFLTFHPENLFLTGLFIPSVRDISDDELWYFWCLTALHATQLIIPLAYTVNTLNNPSKATSLLWTLLEWFSPIPQWRSQLQQLSHNHHLSTIPSHEAEKFTSVFIVHRPYFRHPETAAFFAQPQISHYHTTPHPSTLDQDPMFKKALMNHLLSLNHVPPPPQDIISSSIGPRHDMFMVPNPSGSSKGIIIKEERPDTPPQIYYQDSQDPEDDFLPLSQLLQEFQTPPEQGQSSRVISQSEPIITHPPSQCRSLCIPGIVHAKGCPQYDGPTYLEQCTLFCEPHGANCHKSCVNYRRFESSSSSDDYGMNLSSPELKSFIIMASSSQTPVQLSSSMSLPKTVTKHTTSKLESLVEYSYIPDSVHVNESSLPLVNPYQLYQRHSRFTRSIRSLISTSRSTPKEYIQSSSLDQCSLQSTSAEQYVTLEISPELISHWKQQRYTHFHLGGVRLILTLHGRKGLPVTARIALLDTRFKQYEQATIGTVLTTLHAGSVVLTVYPNFNLSLDDPNLSTFLKIQVQIQGAEQVSSAKIATVHHQLVYRLQNHSLILPTPPDLSSDTLMILAESPDIPTIIQIPRQILRADLLKIMPLEWITNYEHFHQNTTPVQTSEPMYEKRSDGSVRLQFKPPPSAPAEPSRLSFTCSMVQPVDIIPEVLPSGKPLPIMSFTSQGTPVYPDKIDGHFLWDVPGSGRCDPGCPCNDDEDDYSSRSKKKKIIYPACKLYLPEDDDDEPDYPPPLPLYDKGLQWIQKHQPRSCKPVRSSAGLLPTPPMVSCMMFSSASASDYSSEYPPLEKRSDQKHQVWSKPFVNSPISSSGHLEEPKPFEAVLHWQTQNARVQNASLTSLHSKVDQIAHRSSAVETRVTSLSDQLTNLYNSLHTKVAQLDRDLRAMIARGDNSHEFTRKEQEIRQLQAEIARIDADNQRRQAVHTAPLSYFPTEPYHPLGSFFPTTPRDYTPEKVFPMTYHLNPQPAKPKPRPPRRPVPPPTVSIPPPVRPMYSNAIQKPLQIHEPVFPDLPSTSALPPFPESPSKAEQKKPTATYLITAPDLDQLHRSSEESSPSDSVDTFDSITETSEPHSFSSDESQQHLTDISRLLMADHAESTTTDPPPREPSQTYVDIPSDVEGENEGDNSNPPPRIRTKVAPGAGPWFTFDDLPPARWRERLQELSAWLDLQMVKPDAKLSTVLKEFVSRFTGSLRDWFDSLGQYRQLLYLQHPTVSAALMDIHSQFLGEPAAIFATARKEYLQMRCCSMQRSDLHYHFKRMSALFHKIGGINDHTLKHVFLSSLPEELQPEIRRQIANAQLDINNLSLGRLFQLALVSLDYLCDQKKFFRNLIKDKEGFQTACKKPYLEIKCKDSKHCTCPSTKKHHKVRFHRKSSRTPQSRPFPRRPKKIWYFRRRQPSEILDRRRTKSRCFICKKLGHFAKECPKNPKRSQRLVQQLQSLHQFSPDTDQIEFLYCEQESPDPDTVFALGTSDSDSDSTSSTEPEDYSPVFHIQSVPSSSTQLSVQPIPSVKIQILLSKYSRPIPAIAFIDTGAQRSILNPAILPPETWISNENHFRAASGKLFSTKLRTKSRIGIQLFPKLTVWTHVIGSSLPDKDLLLGFDILFQAQKIQVLPTGLRFQSMFQPYTDQLKLYHLAQSPPDYQSISAQLLRFCPPNHLAFAHPHPLWKNPAHFVKLPFKLNEDLNPTKATHPGMPPSELQLAQTECAELLAQGLIEPTTSPWACSDTTPLT